MCLLMNYSWLTPEEEAKLWNLASSRIALDHGFASMILSYFRVFDRQRQLDLVETALAAESYQGREALGQLMTRQRWDLVETTITVCRSLISSAPVETRARLAWFVLLNGGALGRTAGSSSGRSRRILSSRPILGSKSRAEAGTDR